MSKERKKRREAKGWEYVRDNYALIGYCRKQVRGDRWICTMREGHVGRHVATYVLLPMEQRTEQSVRDMTIVEWEREEGE